MTIMNQTFGNLSLYIFNALVPANPFMHILLYFDTISFLVYTH